MIRATFLLAALAVGSILPGAAHAVGIKPTRVVTENGMTVLIADQPSLPIVTVNVLIKAGSVYDPDAKAGLSYMVASTLDEGQAGLGVRIVDRAGFDEQDGKSTRLNSSHGYISYAVFCLKKKKRTSHS